MKTKFIHRASMLLFLIFALTATGCKKLLDEKPVKGLQIPSTLQDFQALLDAYVLINRSDPSAGEMSADDYYLTDAALSSRTEEEKATYTWQNANIFTPGANDWASLYVVVYRANTVLENIGQVQRNASNQLEWDNIKGQAAYLRAKAFLQGVGIWSLAYDEATAASDLGMPLRLGTDFNQPSVRASVKETYLQIIEDLKLAASLLPNTPLHVVRPSKPAAYGLLARTYLHMRDYENALHYADLCLSLKSDLVDYNSISATPSYPMPQFNAEVIHDSYMSTPSILANTYARIPAELYAAYEANDLRKSLFFRNVETGVYGFRGSYVKSAQLFTGLAVDEMYLMRAECLARKGEIIKANNDLNMLLIKRYKTGTFVTLNLTDQQSLLAKVLTERRKELLMRGLRWMDIKRLNKENYNISIGRNYNGTIFSLPAGAKRFALPIPEYVITASGMIQNQY